MTGRRDMPVGTWQRDKPHVALSVWFVGGTESVGASGPPRGPSRTVAGPGSPVRDTRCPERGVRTALLLCAGLGSAAVR